jgi:hypothetical protein
MIITLKEFKMEICKELKKTIGKQIDKTIVNELLVSGILKHGAANFKLSVDAKIHLEIDGVVCDFEIHYPEEVN